MWAHPNVSQPASRRCAGDAADTRSTRGSSGELVTVELSGDPANPEARISRRPRSRMVLHDRGKGRRIVESVIRALRE